MSNPIKQLLSAAIQNGIAAMRDHNLHAETAIRYGLIQALFTRAGLSTPYITSGGRTAQYQRELIDCWSKPECRARRGLVAKPAQTSWHIGGMAFDATRLDPNFDLFVRLWKSLPGGRWGGDFTAKDPVHFDIGGLTAYKLLGYPKSAA